jgi:hypothetical protein
MGAFLFFVFCCNLCAQMIRDKVVHLFSAEMFEEVAIGQEDEEKNVIQWSCRIVPNLIIPAFNKHVFYRQYSFCLPTQLCIILAYTVETIFIERVYEESCVTYNNSDIYHNNSHYSCFLEDKYGMPHNNDPLTFCSLNSTDVLSPTIICRVFLFDKKQLITALSGIYGLHKILALGCIYLIRWNRYVLQKCNEWFPLEETANEGKCKVWCRRLLTYYTLTLCLYTGVLYLMAFSISSITNQTKEEGFRIVGATVTASIVSTCLLITWVNPLTRETSARHPFFTEWKQYATPYKPSLLRVVYDRSQQTTMCSCHRRLSDAQEYEPHERVPLINDTT